MTGRRIRARKPPLAAVGDEPDYRFSLANERTFLAWIRTALALLAAAVALRQFVPHFADRTALLVLALIALALSMVVSALSYRRWQGNERAMRLAQSLPASILPLVLAVGMTLIAAIALVLMIVDFV